ncbi:chemosensory receptor c [Plakobranchus ocellatus]|uniref:Chemosensory receptor c n=1 Tax=Plakobranchus ocellatus TaxID=259542 RepID=A0AAV4A5Y1_9GAST|nr:chemosensory receptor c [Plakobranchus ocellatus]
MCSFRVVKTGNLVTNSSAGLMISFLDSSVVAEAFYLILVKTVLACLEYFTMILCAVAIFVGMRSSIELKNSSSASSKFENHRNIHRDSSKHPDNKGEENVLANDIGGEVGKTEKKRDSKGAFVVKQSLLVVLIQVICTTPRMIVSYYNFLEPRFEVGRQFNNLLYVVYLGINVFDSINASLNFFVYFRFNSKFRNHFKSIFSKYFFARNTKS